MPIFTFPSTIYIVPPAPNPFVPDEIECTVDKPVGPAAGRAQLKLTTNNDTGLSQGAISITVHRSATTGEPTLTNSGSVAIPAGAIAAPVKVGSTITWKLPTATGTPPLPANAKPTFEVPFTLTNPPPAGTELIFTFEVAAVQLVNPVTHYQSVVL